MEHVYAAYVRHVAAVVRYNTHTNTVAEPGQALDAILRYREVLEARYTAVRATADAYIASFEAVTTKPIVPLSPLELTDALFESLPEGTTLAFLTGWLGPLYPKLNVRTELEGAFAAGRYTLKGGFVVPVAAWRRPVRT